MRAGRYRRSVRMPGARGEVKATQDVLGRMLSRTHSVNGTWQFEWDGMDMVRETDPSGNVTRYFIVNGVMMSFARTVSGTTSTYQIHWDALGHVRAVTNSSGTVVFSASYDSWGNTLSVTDSVPNGGFLYRFLGEWGVRTDTDTGLLFCRQRWLDPALQRFISRDLMGGSNRYIYAANSPTSLVDDDGLAPQKPKPTGTPAPPPNPTPAQVYDVIQYYNRNRFGGATVSNEFLLCLVYSESGFNPGSYNAEGAAGQGTWGLLQTSPGAVEEAIRQQDLLNNRSDTYSKARTAQRKKYAQWIMQHIKDPNEWNFQIPIGILAFYADPSGSFDLVGGTAITDRLGRPSSFRGVRGGRIKACEEYLKSHHINCPTANQEQLQQGFNRTR